MRRKRPQLGHNVLHLVAPPCQFMDASLSTQGSEGRWGEDPAHRAQQLGYKVQRTACRRSTGCGPEEPFVVQRWKTTRASSGSRGLARTKVRLPARSISQRPSAIHNRPHGLILAILCDHNPAGKSRTA